MIGYKLPDSLSKDIDKFASLAKGYQEQRVSGTEFKAFRVPLGVYEQRKNEVYMARIRATGGVITPRQLLRVIDIAQAGGSNLLHITTRGEVQILNLDVNSVEQVLRSLQEIGLATKGGGGNTVRNIIVSEFSGIGKSEVFDTTPYAMALTSAMVAEADSYLMPRKLKIAFSSDEHFIDYAGVNDIGLVAQIRDGERGFRVYIGGGAGSKPSVGWLWRDFLPADDLYALVKAVKTFFNAHGNRKDKYKARLRFIFYKLGKEETFRLIDEYFEKEKANANVNLNVNLNLDENKNEKNSQISTLNSQLKSWESRYVTPQRQQGLASVVIPITLGNIWLDDAESVKNLKALLEFVSKFGDNTLRFTPKQNIRLRNIPVQALDELHTLLYKYVPENIDKPAILNNIVSCTGADTCRLGICLSKGLAAAITKALADSGLDLDLLQDARINVSGCPNLCGQPLWSDLGFVGKVLHTDHIYPAYQVYVGANYTDSPALAESIGTISAYDTPKFVVDLVKKFSEAKPQTFNSWLRSAEGRAIAEELIAKYKDIPLFAEDKNYYFDWGSDEVFNVTKRGKPECSAGLFDMIQVDQDNINEARNKNPYAVIFHASRMLLVTRGLDPQDANGVFDAFTEHFIKTGYVSADFTELIAQAKAEGEQGTYDNTRANALADAVIELYQGMDDSLNFRTLPSPSLKGKESSPSKGEIERVRDLRGVLCPMNFVKTKLELATMQSGEVLEIWLDDGKPIENVPGSVRLEGHEILSQTQHSDGYWQVVIKKK
ncbi:MAG: sulfurtransferase TusA family protein [Prevotella sp.]|nr:sulfurtransferase TusA family protein [Prevotella sp.]